MRPRPATYVRTVDRPDFDVGAFLAELDRPASVASVTPTGRPALASMWFCFQDARFWLHSRGGPFIAAADRGALVAVMVETFDPAGRVIKVRATGTARCEATDHERISRIYDRYLSSSSAWTPGWRAQVRDTGFDLWSVEPETGSAVQFPALHDAGGEFRWRTTAAFLDALEPSHG